MARTATVGPPNATSTHPSQEVILVSGVNVATRSAGEGEPVILLNRFRGTLDTWDPAFVSALATRHRIVMFDSLGVGETAGEAATTVEAMADFAAQVIDAMELGSPTVFGWSLGGFVAQILAIKEPRLVGKLILAGTMPAGGSPEAVWSEQWLQTASTAVPSVDSALSLFFTESDSSRSAGRASFARIPARPAAIVSPMAIAAQARAIQRFADHGEGWYARLHEIMAPTFVANGDRDGLFPAIDSAVLARDRAEPPGDLCRQWSRIPFPVRGSFLGRRAGVPARSARSGSVGARFLSKKPCLSTRRPSRGFIGAATGILGAPERIGRRLPFKSP
jgi:pimeloyl-ACP methyl ester carboxylesterase